LNNSNLILDLDNQKSQLIAMHQQLSDTHVQHSANLQQQQQLHDDQFNALKEQYEALQTERNELVQLSESVQQQQQRHNEQFNILQQQYQTLMTERDGVVQARDALKSELSVARADLQHKIDSDKAELNQLLTEQTQVQIILFFLSFLDTLLNYFL
jgi:chromosome segregation ATPase